MMITKKSEYAIKAVFELAKHTQSGPTTIAQIADAQNIPKRFLEMILNQLRQSEFVESQRGSQGGYFLVEDPDQITVGQILKMVSDTLDAKRPHSDQPGNGDSQTGKYQPDVLQPLLDKLDEALSFVLQSFTVQDLLDHAAQSSPFVPNYAI